MKSPVVTWTPYVAPVILGTVVLTLDVASFVPIVTVPDVAFTPTPASDLIVPPVIVVSPNYLFTAGPVPIFLVIVPPFISTVAPVLFVVVTA